MGHPLGAVVYHIKGSVAERSKALVLGTSLSNRTMARLNRSVVVLDHLNNR